jgi:hypothetical protein
MSHLRSLISTETLEISSGNSEFSKVALNTTEILEMVNARFLEEPQGPWAQQVLSDHHSVL